MAGDCGLGDSDYIPSFTAVEALKVIQDKIRDFYTGVDPLDISKVYDSDAEVPEEAMILSEIYQIIVETLG